MTMITVSAAHMNSLGGEEVHMKMAIKTSTMT